jgi:hypothetical protein
MVTNKPIIVIERMPLEINVINGFIPFAIICDASDKIFFQRSAL